VRQVERQRYVKFSIFSEEPVPIDAKGISTLIWRQYNALFGEIKSGRAGFWITDYDPEAQSGIIRCSHSVLEELVTAMTLLTQVGTIDAAFDTTATSGTLKGLGQVRPDSDVELNE
jgi:RNase P/RNase MRP subunit POP5